MRKLEFICLNKRQTKILGQKKLYFFREHMLRIESVRMGMMDWGDDRLIQFETCNHGEL